MGEINTTIGKFTGDISTEEGQKTLCEETKQANEEERNRHKEEEKSIQEYASDTVATFTDGSDGKTAFSSSSKCKNAEHLSQAVDAGQRQNGIDLCNGAKHDAIPKALEEANPDKKYATSKNIAACHCETKIIPDFIQNGPSIFGKTLVGNIDWKKKDLTTDGKSIKALHRLKHPCPDCFRLLCETATSCETTIYLCDNKGNPQNIEESCETEEIFQDGSGHDMLNKLLNGIKL